MRRGSSRLAVLAALAAVPLGAVLAATAALAGDDPVAAAQPVVGALPEWRAPGGRLTLRGVATPDEEVAVRVGRTVVGRTTAGLRGRFRFEVRVPRRPGRYGVVVESAGLAELAGVVRVRPLTLAAVGDVNLDGSADDAWTRVAPILRRADLAVANLECVVSDRGFPVPKEFNFRGPPAALREVAPRRHRRGHRREQPRARLRPRRIPRHARDGARDAHQGRRGREGPRRGPPPRAAERRGPCASPCSATPTSARRASTPAPGSRAPRPRSRSSSSPTSVPRSAAPTRSSSTSTGARSC